MIKVVLFMGISLNGLISSENGDEEFISSQVWEDMKALARRYGCLIWGRRTYENALRILGNRMGELSGIKLVGVSASGGVAKGDYVLAGSPIKALKLLAEDGFQTALLDGGSTLNSAFAQAGLIDEVILDVNPWLVGQGRPLFAPGDFGMKLKFLEAVKKPEGLLQLHYQINK